jgi:hypothetical protein
MHVLSSLQDATQLIGTNIKYPKFTTKLCSEEQKPLTDYIVVRHSILQIPKN